jgi:hypothetical protein
MSPDAITKPGAGGTVVVVVTSVVVVVGDGCGKVVVVADRPDHRLTRSDSTRISRWTLVVADGDPVLDLFNVLAAALWSIGFGAVRAVRPRA